MRWSKVKQLIEANFADSIASRLAIHSAAYGACTCGHAWITLDGAVLANFCTRAHYNRFASGDRSRDSGLSDEERRRYRGQPVEYGEMSRQDVYGACWEYLHDLAFDDALQSSDPLIQTLAVLDRRLGKRRYALVDSLDMHPLARRLFEERKRAEAVRAN